MADTNLGNSIVQNILDGNHVEVWAGPLTKIGMLFGLAFVIIGCVLLAQANGQRGMQRTSNGAAFASIIAGFALLSIQALISAGTMTLFGLDSAGDYSFTSGVLDITDSFQAGSGLSASEAIYIELVVYILQLVGLCAVIKSAFLMREATTNSRSTAAAGWHFLGGIMALNFRGAVEMIKTTGGTEVSSILSKMFG